MHCSQLELSISNSRPALVPILGPASLERKRDTWDWKRVWMGHLHPDDTVLSPDGPLERWGRWSSPQVV